MKKLMPLLSLSFGIVFAPLNSAAAPKTNDSERGESVRIQTKTNPLLKEFKREQAVYIKRNFGHTVGPKSCQEDVETETHETLEKQLAEQGFHIIPQPENSLSQLPYFSVDQHCVYSDGLSRQGDDIAYASVKAIKRGTKTVFEFKPFVHPMELATRVMLVFPGKSEKRILDDKRIAWFLKYSHSYELDLTRSPHDLSKLIQRIVQQAVAALGKEIDKNEREAVQSKENNSGNTAAPTARP